MTREFGREKALCYPDWLDEKYEFVVRWNVRDLMEYYTGIITPAISATSGQDQSDGKKQIFRKVTEKIHGAGIRCRPVRPGKPAASRQKKRGHNDGDRQGGKRFSVEGKDRRDESRVRG